MGDEVTKKDLQSLQGYCNKQIADVRKELGKGLVDETAALNKTIEAINKSIEAINKSIEAINKSIEQLNKNDAEFKRVADDHAKLIAELQKKCG